jgi:predicted adenine nucleotide alpha hydrolase (AANH) superfamily ATPase
MISSDIAGLDGKILLLACCAPCCCSVVEFLALNRRDATLFFHNPNIYPREEYEKRKHEVLKVARTYGMPCVDTEYRPEEFDAVAAGLEKEPERGRRCSACFFLRLSRAAEYARQNGYDCFASTLGFSRWKNPMQVDEAGAKAAAMHGVIYLPVDWRKEGLQPRSRELIREQEIYEQSYCGCKWSMKREQA